MPFAFFIFAFVRFVPPCFFCLPFSFPASPPLAFSFPPVFSCLLPLFSAPRIPFLSIHALLSLLFFFFYPTPFSPPPSSKLPLFSAGIFISVFNAQFQTHTSLYPLSVEIVPSQFKCPRSFFMVEAMANTILLCAPAHARLPHARLALFANSLLFALF